MIDWQQHIRLPAMRTETHFGDRVLRCFVDRPPSLYAMLEHAVARYPDREALACGEQRWSYRELNAEVDRIAAGFAGHGLCAGERVVMFIGNRLEFVSVLFELQKIGAIAVPVGTREQGPGLAYILQQCGAAAIVLDEALLPRLPDKETLPSLRLRICVSDTAIADVAGADGASNAGSAIDHIGLHELRGNTLAAARVNEEDCACILYTSGTTGNPKGAMLTHFNIAHSVIHFSVTLKLDHQDRAALAVPASHVTGLVALIAVMVHVGGALIIVPEFKAAAFVDVLAREKISYGVMVPSMYQLCLLQPSFFTADLSAWRVGGYGGAPMPVPTVQALGKALPGLILVNCYGSTETSSPSTIMPLGLSAIHHDSVGIAAPCADIRVMDENGEPVAMGESGELWIGGPMVVPGYWDNPEATTKGFAEGCWRSGDVGSIDAQGLVRVFDRIKDMINRGGFKIYSVEVENTLMALPGVVEAAVVGYPCPILGERVHAYLYAPNHNRDADSVRTHCAARLADYKVPEEIFFSDTPLPRNPNGKLLKRSLRG
jgi:O-succinylbenzoic acid--CoA ligase